MSETPRTGTLYVVATPIGNLDDITLRALEVLGRVDVIACEDTRRTRGLLERHRIRGRMLSLHRFNEHQRAGKVLESLEAGESVALVSDAGTPCLSDPGAELVARAAAQGVPVVPVPGPAAPTALLSVSGLAGTRHTFLGFLPHREGERRRLLEDLAGRQEVLVLLEAPTRIAGTLSDLAEILGGERRAVLGRELTKLHEEILRGTLAELARQVAGAEPRGEYTLAVTGATEATATLPEGTIPQQVRRVQERMGMDRKEAMRYVAREHGIPRRDVYRELLSEEE